MRHYDRDGGKWAGLERALRDQMIKEGNLPPSDDAEATGDSATMCLELADEFERTFTEDRLGLALNVGEKGRAIVKRCVQGTPASRRRIPPGVFLMHVNATSTEYKSLAQVQELIKTETRPLCLRFKQSESSRAIAEGSHRQAKLEVVEEKATHEAAVAARKQAEIDRQTTVYETAETFSRTFAEERLGICLGDPGVAVKGKAFVAKCLPGSVAFKAGVPPGAYVIAINGRSVEFRSFKEVKKLLQIASRPVTVDFSLEERPTFPVSSGKTSAIKTPGYALKPM